MSTTLTYMLLAWPLAAHLDRRRIGAFGLSAGGLTALLAAGARPDLSRIASWCAGHAASFTCTLIAKQKLASEARLPPLQDTRFKAMAIAAPALGFTMTRSALAPVTLPIQLWQAMDEAVLPSYGSVEPVRDNLPLPPEFHAVAKAGHFDFLAPCRSAYHTMTICRSAPDFNRSAFHDAFNHALTDFYNRTLLSENKALAPKR